jgi:hypothetical protein
MPAVEPYAVETALTVAMAGGTEMMLRLLLALAAA